MFSFLSNNKYVFKSLKRRRFIKRSLLIPLQFSVLSSLTLNAKANMLKSDVSTDAPAGEINDSFMHLNLLNAHTNDRFNGQITRNNLSEINHVLRDHRQNKSTDMDKSLLDFLLAIQNTQSAPVKFKVFSGYRSPKTNAHLAANSTGVAKKSLHMQGRAIDVCIEGMSATQLAKIARKLKLGGVGCYKRSGFVHLDTGAVRHWNG